MRALLLSLLEGGGGHFEARGQLDFFYLRGRLFVARAEAVRHCTVQNIEPNDQGAEVLWTVEMESYLFPFVTTTNCKAIYETNKGLTEIISPSCAS